MALARLILADPHTLVLDEATSLLDPRAARHLERSLNAVLEGRTVIAIAHRLHTAHDADRIAVVEDGRISELGSHDELVAADGAYAVAVAVLARRRLIGQAPGMGRLITLGITSLDGYVADADGSFAWAEPDEELHRYCNALEAAIGINIYGRLTYELMTYWADPPADAGEVELEYAAAWQDSDKIVVSTTLEAVTTPRTTLWRSFDADAVAALKATTEQDISISGPTLAAAAFEAGLVDEVGVILLPVTVGGGTPYLPSGVRLDLELLGEHRFTSGAVHLRYAVRR